MSENPMGDDKVPFAGWPPQPTAVVSEDDLDGDLGDVVPADAANEEGTDG